MNCLLVKQQPLVVMPPVVVCPLGGLIARLRDNQKGSEKPIFHGLKHHALALSLCSEAH